MRKITKEILIKDLKNLGVGAGDTVFAAADLLMAGYFSANREQTLKDWIDVLLSAVGEEGTLVIPAYTKSFLKFKKDEKIIFTENSMPDAGALSTAFYNYPGVRRSKHPTNSCFAIGRHADFILEGHDANSLSYLPYSKIVELKGKNLMIGAFADKRLAPMAMHCAQEFLGITKRKWSVGLSQSYYFNEIGERKLFTRRDVGGCTAGGFKSLGHHILGGAISFGYVGKGLSAYIDCQKSMEIFLEIFTKNPHLLRCDNSMCRDCFGSPIHMHPFFWAKTIWREVKNKYI